MYGHLSGTVCSPRVRGRKPESFQVNVLHVLSQDQIAQIIIHTNVSSYHSAPLCHKEPLSFGVEQRTQMVHESKQTGYTCISDEEKKRRQQQHRVNAVNTFG